MDTKEMNILEAFRDEKYVNLDLERLFKETNDITVAKTLQKMHLAAFQLDQELTSFMTNDIESIMLYATNILVVCDFVRRCESNLHRIAVLSSNFSLDSVETDEDDNSKSENLLCFFNGCKKAFGDGTIDDSLISEILKNQAEKKPLNRVEIIIGCVKALRRVNLDNYRLLKRGKIFEAYELLFVRSPLLIKIAEYFLDCVELPLVEKSQFGDFLSQMPKLLDFTAKRLKAHCFQVLGSPGIRKSLEAAVALVSMDGVEYNVKRIISKSFERIKMESSILNCSNAKETISCFFSHAALCIFLLSLKDPKGTGSENTTDCEEGYSKVSIEDLFLDTEVVYVVSSFFGMQMKEIPLENLSDAFRDLKTFIFQFPMCGNVTVSPLYSSKMMRVGLQGVAIGLVHIMTLEYNRIAKEEAQHRLDQIDQLLMEYKDCSAEVVSLYKFVRDGEFIDVKDVVSSQLSQSLSRAKNQVELVCETEDGEEFDFFGQFGIDGRIACWLQETGLKRLIFSLEEFPEDFYSECEGIREIVAFRCLSRIIAAKVDTENLLDILMACKCLKSQLMIWNGFKRFSFMHSLDKIGFLKIFERLSQTLPRGTNLTRLKDELATVLLLFKDFISLYKHYQRMEDGSLSRKYEALLKQLGITPTELEEYKLAYETMKHSLL